MEIKNEVTKEIFESYVPGAKMPERNDSVYNRLKEHFQLSYEQLIHQTIGNDSVAAAESDTAIKQRILRFVCLHAFITVARSLDLVLTATGFGVVSTNSMTPASKTRVDAFINDCRMEALMAHHGLVEHLVCLEGWGGTFQARVTIQCLFWHINHLRTYTALQVTADSWQSASGLALVADAFLRKAISTEYMDELLDKVRTHSCNNDDQIIIGRCLRFIGGFVSGYEYCKEPNQQQLDAIVDILETFISHYPTYQQSETYKGRHAERYQNKKEDPTFFFM